MLGASERRIELLKILCIRRHETISNLAIEFGTSERTIRRDIEVLSLTEPIYTQAGRYGGGVYVMDGYYYRQMYMSKSELDLLHRIALVAHSFLNGDEQKLLMQIIKKYTKPSI